MSNKYDTLIGERGIRLSGGQCQRIGIARALYKDAKVLFFDEATSSLDAKTENEVMSSIENIHSSEITVIIIAHRISTLKKCDVIYELNKGQVAKVGKYEDFIWVILFPFISIINNSF